MPTRGGVVYDNAPSTVVEAQHKFRGEKSEAEAQVRWDTVKVICAFGHADKTRSSQESGRCSGPLLPSVPDPSVYRI